MAQFAKTSNHLTSTIVASVTSITSVVAIKHTSFIVTKHTSSVVVTLDSFALDFPSSGGSVVGSIHVTISVVATDSSEVSTELECRAFCCFQCEKDSTYCIVL